MNPGLENSRVDEQPSHAVMLARSQHEGFLRHFSFREPPFGVTPNPEFLFWSRMHNSALQGLVNAIESNLGFSVLLGHPGTGKTTLIFHLLAQYRESARTAFVFQTQCKPHDLIRHIASELELPPARGDDVFLHRKLSAMLLKEARAGRKVLIVIDEAQNLNASSLEALRLLSDFETGPSKLLHVVLSGSPRLGETLLSSELWQLAQRITTISRLEPLSAEEVRDYVRFRLAVVSSRSADSFFSPEALAEVASESGGIPRLVNSICHSALILACAQRRPSVSKELVTQAVHDLDLSEPGIRDLRTVAKHREKSRPSDGSTSFNRETCFPENVGRVAEFRGKSADQRFPLNDARVHPTSARQTAPASTPVRTQGVLKAQAVTLKPDRSGRIGMPGIFQSRRAGWAPRGMAALIAALLLLAFVAWAGWREFQARPGTNTRYSQADTGVAQKSAEQGNPAETENVSSSAGNKSGAPIGAPLPTNSAIPESAQLQTSHLANMPPKSASLDERPNSLLPSKIRPPSETQQQPEPSNVVAISRTQDNLPSLVAGYHSSLPQLEATEKVSTPSPAPDAPHTIIAPTTVVSLDPIKTVQPEYPMKARLWHIEGDVDVELTVNQNGAVTKVRGLSGNAILLQAAEEAARQWRYPPSSEGNQFPTPAVTRVRFNFKLAR